MRRVFRKEQLYSGNIETFRKSFLSKDSMLRWVITHFHYRRRRYENIRAQNQYSHLKWIELRRPREVEGLLQRLVEAGATD